MNLPSSVKKELVRLLATRIYHDLHRQVFSLMETFLSAMILGGQTTVSSKKMASGVGMPIVLLEGEKRWYWRPCYQDF
jgi:hypothetical protein